MNVQEDPVLSADELNEIADLLLCHGLQNNLAVLSSKIMEQCPELVTNYSSPTRQLVILLAFCSKLQQKGPLPEIRDHAFLHTLHNGLVGLLKVDHRLVELMTRLDLYKLVAGLRCLLAVAVIRHKKFTPKDIEITIASYFPILPVRPSNCKYWENWGNILQIDVEVISDELKAINSVNKKNVNHLTSKLDNLPVERAKVSHDESIMTIWNVVAPKFDAFVTHLRSLTPGFCLEKIASHSDPKIKMLSPRINPNDSEEELTEFFDILCDIYLESQFWTSELVLSKIV